MNEELKKRLEGIYELYDNIEGILNSLPDSIPDEIRSKLKKIILEDQELKDLLESLRNARPPRFVLVGRTRVGKSSFINAILGSYVADISDVESETKKFAAFDYKKDGSTVLSVIDSRGIGEADNIAGTKAEDFLLHALDDFTPDVLLFIIRCSSVDYLDKDVVFVKNVCGAYEKKNKLKIPVLVVLNRADEMAPSQYKKASDYTPKKMKNIEDAVEYVRKIVIQQGLKYKNIVPISSYIDWGLTDGELKRLTNVQKEALEIEFDGRYNIEFLLQQIEDSIEDANARKGLMIAGRVQDVLLRVARKITNTVAGIAGFVGTTPLPVSDIIVLCTLQAVLVKIIAGIGGKKLDMESAGEFVVGLGGVAVVGFAFRTIAQQAAKLLNALFPGAGSLSSGVIASTGTKLIGEAAIKYYINGLGMEEVRAEYENKKNEKASGALA
jgi:predicted GTPase